MQHWGTHKQQLRMMGLQVIILLLTSCDQWYMTLMTIM